MLLGTQLFADKSGNRIHIRWLPFMARLEEMGGYSWGSAALAWLYRCMCRVANRHVVKPTGYDAFSWPLASRWSGYNPVVSEKGPRVQMARLRIDMLQARDVVHPEVMEPRHTMLWRCVMSLIYFAVVEWHQDGRGGDRWFPSYLQHWHLHWETRADHVLRFDVVAVPGPSHEFLDWWHQHGKRFLSPEMYLGDPRGIPIPVEATQRGAGRVLDMDRVDDVPDKRRVERRARVETRRSQREWRWLDQAMEEGDEAGRGGGQRRGRGSRRRGLLLGRIRLIVVRMPLEEVLQWGVLGPLMADMVESGMDPVWEIHRAMLTLGLEWGRSEITSLACPVTTRHFRRVRHE
ncbi:hypothetical protein Ahy_B01g053751 [Arachis hypogaea]|uniref:Aminotransferase-like plant mobile domain-containing protein n=1 Tax=Arachis hypogaea TaxID=3818 RepID=A0A445ASK1_ARAHY|nr:hypothetical protein Ahy_B01g053751 [Arachis hypogaea]